jgi:chaperonin GroES
MDDPIDVIDIADRSEYSWHSTASSAKYSAGHPRPIHHSHEAIPMKMKVQPLNDRVLVMRMEPEQKSKKGIIIPDTAKEKPLEGKVIAVGAGRLDDDGKRIALEVKVGDHVLVGKYMGTEVRIEDIEHVIVREEEILGIVS